MFDLKDTIAANIIHLRNQAGMKQSDLAEKINYSDKSVSKWERGAAVPDIGVLKSIADIFGVTVDYLITAHDESEMEKRSRDNERHALSVHSIIELALAGVMALALLIFIVFWLLGHIYWQIFIYFLPIAMLVLLILHSVFEKGKYNFYIISGFLMSILLAVYFMFFQYNWWQIFILAVPAELIVWLCFRIKRPQKKPKKP